MKILLLFEHSNHNIQMDRLGEELFKKGFSVASFNVVSFRYVCYNNGIRAWWILALRELMRIPKVRGLLLIIFRKIAILNLSKYYDYIDIHFLGELYDGIIPNLKTKNKKVKVTLWGSDFFRVSEKRREEQRALLKKVDIIQVGTEQVQKYFFEYYPEFKVKTKVAHFGNNKLANIENYLTQNELNSFKEAFNIPSHKIIIALGTNASEGHRHMRILDDLSKLSKHVKDTIFLLFPMNYGGNSAYINEVREKADATGIPYVMLTEFMDKDEFAKVVVACDIIISIQVTDSFSAAIQEFIYAGCVLIAGEWLPYDIFRDNGIYYRKVSLESLYHTIEDTIIHLDTIKLKCVNNHENIYRLSDWSYVIDKWVDIYRLGSEK